jgi:hypothetical protein
MYVLYRHAAFLPLRDTGTGYVKVAVPASVSVQRTIPLAVLKEDEEAVGLD